MAKLIKTLLVANRGEIAKRIFKTCKKEGIKTIAIYSSLDSNTNYVQEADISVLLEGENPVQCHLDSSQIIKIAKKFEADAIHPGTDFCQKMPLLQKNVMMKISYLSVQILTQLNSWEIKTRLDV